MTTRHGTLSGYNRDGCRCEICTATVRDYNKKLKAANPERTKADNRKYLAKRRTRPLRVKRNEWLKWRYRITIDDYDRMWRDQNGACRICKTVFETERHACVDHDHNTGKVRSLLCSFCNIGLGSFRDNPLLCEAAASYLRIFQ